MASGPCGCSNISIMQLFHQLKQDFPAAPDEVVMQCIRQHAHDKAACERALQRRTFMVHNYPAALMTGATRMPLGSLNHDGVPKAARGDLGLDVVLGPPSTPSSPSSPSPPARSSALHRQPRKLRPAPPPPPVATALPPPPASSPSPTPPRLRPAPAPPPLARPVNGPAGDHGHVMTVVDVNCSVSRVPPPGPPPQRHTASMAIQPASPYPIGVVPPRSYTSVNLTLRPPAADQPPIDIHSGGSSLTYSTSSYDPRQGYQSQLQISIGPGGLGSVSAMRTRAPTTPPAPSSPRTRPTVSPPSPQPPPRHRLMSPLAEQDEGPARWTSREDLEKAIVALGGKDLSQDVREHLVRQLERRALLETELHKERTKLRVMQREVAEMERDLERRTSETRPRGPPAFPVMEKVQRLRTEIQSLQEECTRMTNEVDAKAPDSRPVDTTEPGWTCQTCTFHNHYLLEACEQCEVPRIRLGSNSCPASLHAVRLPSPTGILPSLASPALETALAPLSLNSNTNCVPNMLTPLPGHEE